MEQRNPSRNPPLLNPRNSNRVHTSHLYFHASGARANLEATPHSTPATAETARRESHRPRRRRRQTGVGRRSLARRSSPLLLHPGATRAGSSNRGPHAERTPNTPYSHHDQDLPEKQRPAGGADAVTRPRAAPRHPTAHTALRRVVAGPAPWLRRVAHETQPNQPPSANYINPLPH